MLLFKSRHHKITPSHHRFGEIEHPIDPKAVGEFSVGGAPKGLVQWCMNMTACRKVGKKGIDFFFTETLQAEGNAIATLQVGADHIGPHQDDPLIDQGTVQDVGLATGRHLRRHGGFSQPLQGQFSAETLLVKCHGLAALAIEIEIRVQYGGHGEFDFDKANVDAPAGGEGV